MTIQRIARNEVSELLTREGANDPTARAWLLYQAKAPEGAPLRDGSLLRYCAENHAYMLVTDKKED